jgi:hypothetical protein
MIRRLAICAWFACFAPEVCAVAAEPSATAQPEERNGLAFFEARIRPVLIKHCYECHSAESKNIKGGLLLDSREGLLRGGESGPAVVVGKPDESLLLQALRQDGFEMPPAGKLPDAVIADFEKWVRLGAPDPRVVAASPKRSGINLDEGRKFWCFQPPRDAAVPPVKNSAWPATDVDRFILARLESQQLAPSPAADRRVLIRRATFDLLGLPPTPAEIEAFEADDSPDALARLVDRLLASPHFGERWGRHWLDVVRFAESSGGGRSLIFKQAWRYRDYVVGSFNADKPFDRFVTEQLAGDLLPAKDREQSQEQLVATALLMLGAINYEEQDKAALELDVVDEQLDTIGRAFMGMTLGCARCHDHKFDPIPTRDYYALAGILHSTKMLVHENVSHWTERPLPQPTAEEQQWTQEQAQAAALEAKIRETKVALKKLVGEKRGDAKKPIAVADLPGLVLDDKQAKRIGVWTESTIVKPFIGEGYLHDDDGTKGQNTLTFVPEFTRAGLYEVRLAYTPAGNRATSVPVEILHLDGEFSGKVDQSQTPDVDGQFTSLGRFRFDETNQWFVRISNEGTAGTVAVDAVQFLPVDRADAEDPKAAVAQSDSKEKESQEAVVLAKAEAKMAKELKELQEHLSARPTVMAVEECRAIEDCAIRIRGNVDQRGEVVPRGFLQVASVGSSPTLPSTESGRRELAAWITRPDHPLTARVIVNRVWSYLFGAGIVRTVDNLGRTGEAPSHPELLDHLAVRFVREGWSIKKLIRELMLSNVYQQSSAARADLAARDPDNRLLGRMNRRRLDAESLRDAILVASGQVDMTIGGPTIRELKKGDKAAASATEYGYVFDDSRRSIYTPAFRNRLLELFETFDFADPNSVVGQRNVSTVAPQALYLLNSPFVMAQAGLAADQLLSVPGLNDTDRIERMFQSTLGRPPRDNERRLMIEAVASSKEGASLSDSAELARRRAAWQRVYQALFGCLDFRYLD